MSDWYVRTLLEEKRQLLEYIREYGFCGYSGEPWTNKKLKCLECIDKTGCERYQLLVKFG